MSWQEDICYKSIAHGAWCMVCFCPTLYTPRHTTQKIIIFIKT
jgi:hypothetical protein